MARRATRTGLRGWLASLVPQLTGIGLTIINVSRADPRLMARTSYSDRTMETLAELIDLSRILLNLARSREFPYGSPRHGYDFIAPLDSEGHIDPILWQKYREYCRVRRFWAGEEDEVGRLVHKPGGAEHARWVFDYNPDKDDDDEAGYKFGAHAFLPGEYVSISGQDGNLHTFLVVTVDPVVLSVDLVKSFELEIKV
jgi:hypothetical protein